MGVRILEGTYDGTETGACLVDSVTGSCFGPLMDDGDEAQAFLRWLPEDARRYIDSDLQAQYVAFVKERT